MHLSYQEHVKIYSGLCHKMSMREIARSIGRSTSTISREVARNSDSIGYLLPKMSYDRQLEKRGNRKKKIDRNQKLKEYITKKIRLSWSPKVIAGRWNKENKKVKISHETIYNWLFSRGNEELKKYLPRAKSKRGLPRKKPKKSKIPYRVGIHMRPSEINNRSNLGDFEADLVFNKGSMSANVLTMIDRKSRYAIFVKNQTKQTMEVIEGLKKLVTTNNIRSVTFDNGLEFASHNRLKEENMIDTYFCDPGKPWQKGSIEHLNGMLRRRIAFEVEPSKITQQSLDLVAHDLNHMPRESLGFMTPCEVFNGSFQKEIIKCCIF